MMPLSTMWNVDRTIDASGSSPVAAQILARWAHDKGSVRFFRSSANFLYVFHREGERHFLRFADGAERSRDAVEAEVALLRWLAGEGITVALPVRSIKGTFVETVTTDHGTFHAVVFPAVKGDQYDIGELDGTRFREWGAALGQIHVAMIDCPPAIFSARGTWRDRLQRARRSLPDRAPSVREELGQIASALDAFPVSRDTYGLIHFDFELDNLVWGDHTIHVLDFDDCAHCWYEADIAFALRDLFEGEGGQDDPAFREFMRGYATQRPVEADALARLPLFSRLADFLAYASIARALDLVEDLDHPDWLRDLMSKLRNRMGAYERSLAAGRS